jgi:hypothetical protein
MLPRTLQTIEELRLALLEFRETYNATWLIERHGFISPEAFRRNQLQPTHQARLTADKPAPPFRQAPESASSALPRGDLPPSALRKPSRLFSTRRWHRLVPGRQDHRGRLLGVSVMVAAVRG